MANDKPFFIIGSKGKFATCYQGRDYLPPIELDDLSVEPIENLKYRSYKEYLNEMEIDQLKGRIVYLQNKLNLYLDKKKSKYNIYK